MINLQFTNNQNSIKMSYENIILETDQRTAVITINRPQSLNALNAQTISELSQVLDEVQLTQSTEQLLLLAAVKNHLLQVLTSKNFLISEQLLQKI